MPIYKCRCLKLIAQIIELSVVQQNEVSFFCLLNVCLLKTAAKIYYVLTRSFEEKEI